ncbi:DUF6559 family protein [Pseudoteredinibacter isoporae]|uniref:DUF6559 family protein n=1 Tax=Pseudoteredinibacter isoporae TaxID=570281 RepID=UPI00310405E0
MGILMKMRESRAIKKIARNLPPFLASGYGGGEVYTPGQVENAMEETGCDTDFIDHAYAMYCSKEAFDNISDGNYESLQSEFGEVCSQGGLFSSSDASLGDIGGDSGGGD